MSFLKKILNTKKKGKNMDIIKRLFTFNNDESSAIGLCKFNDDFFNSLKAKEKAKSKIKDQTSLSQMLRRAY